MSPITETELQSGSVPKDSASSEPNFAEGHVVGQFYELQRRLGAGGMGIVYEAHDHALNRRVAIKVARGASFAKTLTREARIMAAFEHPGLPTVYALGTSGDGLPYVVMERLHGQSLASYIHSIEATFSAEETRYILTSVIDSLHVLHSAYIAHRDIKPSNIMLVPPNRVVLLDFGISDMERYAAHGAIVGSPHYMSPEVAAGRLESGKAHLADIYALGVIGYQMLSGRKPFRGQNIAEIVSQHLTVDPIHLRDLCPDVPVAMTDLIMEMLAKEPARRPNPIENIAERLRAVDIGGVMPDVKKSNEPAKIRILIADDEPSIWSLLSYVFEDHGYDIVCVEDGQQALAEFERSNFDIVIADKNMPRLDGLALLEQVRALRPSTDFVMITGYPSMDAAVQALNLGAVRFLQKPFDIDDLARTVEHLASRHIALRNNGALVETFRASRPSWPALSTLPPGGTQPRQP